MQVLMVADTDEIADELESRLGVINISTTALEGIGTRELMTALRDRIVMLSSLMSRIDSATLVGAAMLGSNIHLDGYDNE